MQATKGILAALGAATSLLAAGALALFTVSLIVAFQGWPDVSGAPAHGVQVALHDPLRDAARGGHRDRIVIHAGPARVHHQADHATAPQATFAATRSAGGPRATTPVLTASSGHARPVSSPAPAHAPTHEPLAVKHTTDTLGTAVTDGTHQLGEALRPASPTLANTVDQVGQVVGKTVTNLGNVVNSVLTTLLTGQPPK